MYRKIKGNIHGVLADYDLASLRSTLTLDRTKTSQQRTGTPPFMAHGLLNGNDPIHLYRHDLESLFYTMLILATHYEIRAPGKEGRGMEVLEGELRFQAWFETSDYNGVGERKFSFLVDLLQTFKPSPSFENFFGWLRSLRTMFNRGLTEKNVYISSLGDGEDGGDDARPSFDDETLGGHVTYSALIQTVRNLTGELRGLDIRYDPPRAPPSAEICAVQAHT